MRDITFNIDDHVQSPQTTCTQYYVVEYKPTYQENWLRLLPNPMDSPFEIRNLLDDTVYDISVSRVCCDGNQSPASTSTFDTTLTSPE